MFDICKIFIFSFDLTVEVFSTKIENLRIKMWQLWAESMRLLVGAFTLVKKQTIPGWSPRDNQLWTALFQRFAIY